MIIYVKNSKSLTLILKRYSLTWAGESTEGSMVKREKQNEKSEYKILTC